MQGLPIWLFLWLMRPALARHTLQHWSHVNYFPSLFLKILVPSSIVNLHKQQFPHSGSSVWQAVRNSWTIHEVLLWFILGAHAVEQLSIKYLFGYSTVIKVNERACLVKSMVINVCFDANCIDFFKDNGVCKIHGGYKFVVSTYNPLKDIISFLGWWVLTS